MPKSHLDQDPSQISDSQEAFPEQVWNELSTLAMVGEFGTEIRMPEDSDGDPEVIIIEMSVHKFLNLECFPANPERSEPVALEIEEPFYGIGPTRITESHNFEAAQRVIWEKILMYQWKKDENINLRHRHVYANSIKELDELPEIELWERDPKTEERALAYPAVVRRGHKFIYQHFPYQSLAEEKQRHTDAAIKKKHEEMVAGVEGEHGPEMAEKFEQTIEWVKSCRGYCDLLLDKWKILVRTKDLQKGLKEARIFYNRDNERWEAMITEGNSTNFYKVNGDAKEGRHLVQIEDRKSVSIFRSIGNSSEGNLMLMQACPTNVIEDTRERLKESQAAETPNEMKQRELATKLVNGAMPEEILEHNNRGVEEELRKLWVLSDCNSRLFNDHPLIKLDAVSTKATVDKDGVHFPKHRWEGREERNGVEIDWVEFYMQILRENDIYDADIAEVADDFRHGYLEGRANLSDFISSANRTQIKQNTPEIITVDGQEYDVTYTPTYSTESDHKLFSAKIFMSRAELGALEENLPKLPTGQIVSTELKSTW